ncbi:MAG TPA: cobaltochelatase subunit CobN, partial [Pyrinomonadaceae bacterium]|nr:cobaltochelatase subunit CobN [Pyrinomonadaceae bacterium]
PLKNAERELVRDFGLDLHVAAYNFGASFPDDEWNAIEHDLRQSEIVFVIHVMDGENASRLLTLLDARESKGGAVIVINCMPELMKRTRMSKLDFGRLAGISRKGAKAQSKNPQNVGAQIDEAGKATSLLGSIGSWIGKQARGNRAKNGKGNGHRRAQYLELTNRLPSLLRFVPSAGALRDVKNYLTLFCYFLQPTPTNIRSMLLYALKHYVSDERLKRIKIPPPETMPAVAIYHPDAASLFESFEDYRRWYLARGQKEKVKRQKEDKALDPQSTIGLLLMRPPIVSNARRHYDGLIRAIEAEGLSVIPAISTLMDNREACEKFFIDRQSNDQLQKSKVPNPARKATNNGQLTTDNRVPRVSQIVSLTGFSFVGGPAMNDSDAAAEYLAGLNIPYRSLVSLDTQTIDSWRESPTGLNPVQTGMQVAIPEIDGATEPFVFGGIPERGVEPAPLEVRCQRIARRLQCWQRLQTTPRSEIKLALVVYCFPPNKGNIGTAADLDVLASVWDVLKSLQSDGYHVRIPDSVDALRAMLLGGSAEVAGATANVAYRMSVDEYRRLCPFANDIEAEWGPAPGAINSAGGELLIQGIQLDNVFIGVQPTFGYEGDPMRLLVAKGGAPHHGFAAFYAYVEKTLHADAVVHVGTHGAMEFMPGKQVGLSEYCWPDRLIGELPNIYIYSVNNPSEGTIAKRRSYAELISYLTPPIENAGLYRGLAALKETIAAYRQATDQGERESLFQSIEECSRELNLNPAGQTVSL